MERSVDAIEAFQQGIQEGQAIFINLVNKYCGFDAKDIPQLIIAINALKEPSYENH